MVRGIDGAEIVHGMKDCEEFVKRMGRLASEMGIKIYAWALMANHAHILQRSGPSGLPRYTRRFLSSYARYYNRSTTGMGTSSRTAINRLCAMRQSEAEENSDEKVLGSGEFVDRLLAEAEDEDQTPTSTSRADKARPWDC